jgi:large conductance mechanosensitive channel
MLNEFKKFAIKGNVMDMAIGIIIGGAFGKIVSSLVTDVIMPPIGYLTGGMDFSAIAFTLKEATLTEPAVTLNIGIFINTIIDFLIISFSIFFLIRQLNKLRKKDKEKTCESPEEIKLLREIRDALKKPKKVA